MCVIDQVYLGQDGWILAKFFFCMFIDRDGVEFHKLTKKEWDQYPPILTEKAWSVEDLLYGFRRTEQVVLSGILPLT